jgi:hypothetical protein
VKSAGYKTSKPKGSSLRASNYQEMLVELKKKQKRFAPHTQPNIAKTAQFKKNNVPNLPRKKRSVTLVMPHGLQATSATRNISTP